MRGHITMRKIRELLRLKWELKNSNQNIATSLVISSSTVHDCLRRAISAKLSWPLPDDLTDEVLEQKLYPAPKKISPEARGELDWHKVYEELKRKHMTLMLLWDEYRGQYPEGIGYSQFCYLYREWESKLEVWMHQDHKAGEKMFVDYAGDTVAINDGNGGSYPAQIFIAILGASNYTYAEATATQSLSDWIGSHCRALDFFGGVPELVVPDNLKAGVSQAHRYEPDINPTYSDLANYYGFAIMPARVRAPKDKSKVEKAVQHVECQILARLRNRIFFSLAELNDAIAILLEKINTQPFQKLPGSRFIQFEKLDKPALKPLPNNPYEFAEWKKAKLGPDYHIELERHYYSAPYAFTKKILDVRYTSQTVEIFYRSQRIAVHVRRYKYGYSTQVEHMPKAHQKYAEWTPERIVNWAQKTGEMTAEFIKKIITSKVHPQLAFRSCLGILRLGKIYGDKRLELACRRALTIGSYSYKSIESILKNNLDQRPVTISQSLTTTKQTHENVRGGEYFM